MTKLLLVIACAISEIASYANQTVKEPVPLADLVDKVDQARNAWFEQSHNVMDRVLESPAADAVKRLDEASASFRAYTAAKVRLYDEVAKELRTDMQALEGSGVDFKAFAHRRAEAIGKEIQEVLDQEDRIAAELAALGRNEPTAQLYHRELDALKDLKDRLARQRAAFEARTDNGSEAAKQNAIAILRGQLQTNGELRKNAETVETKMVATYASVRAAVKANESDRRKSAAGTAAATPPSGISPPVAPGNGVPVSDTGSFDVSSRPGHTDPMTMATPVHMPPVTDETRDPASVTLSGAARASRSWRYEDRQTDVRTSESMPARAVIMIGSLRPDRSFKTGLRVWFRKDTQTPDIGLDCNCSIDKGKAHCSGVSSQWRVFFDLLAEQAGTAIGEELPKRLSVSGEFTQADSGSRWPFGALLFVESQ